MPGYQKLLEGTGLAGCTRDYRFLFCHQDFGRKPSAKKQSKPSTQQAGVPRRSRSSNGGPFAAVVDLFKVS